MTFSYIRSNANESASSEMTCVLSDTCGGASDNNLRVVWWDDDKEYDVACAQVLKQERASSESICSHTSLAVEGKCMLDSLVNTCRLSFDEAKRAKIVNLHICGTFDELYLLVILFDLIWYHYNFFYRIKRCPRSSTLESIWLLRDTTLRKCAPVPYLPGMYYWIFRVGLPLLFQFKVMIDIFFQRWVLMPKSCRTRLNKTDGFYKVVYLWITLTLQNCYPRTSLPSCAAPGLVQSAIPQKPTLYYPPSLFPLLCRP